MLYDYRSEDEVQYVVVNELSDIISDIVSVYESLRRGEFLTVYASYNIAYDIADYMIHSKGMYLDEESDAIDGQPKDEETIITISWDGDVFVEEARLKNGELKRSLATLDYVYDSFKKSDIDFMSLTEDSILVFGFDEESASCTTFAKNFAVSEDDLHGFEISKTTDNGYCSYSFYTTEDLPVEVMQSIADILK